ncbi:D-alanyl-D-alanine carboxypeptidase [Thiomicrospira microaerophila]|uniref:D-alanyl-D-alanine carboxypeptidase family protein n=1 Tax=Thiomicrospira microaerophila TaxID=406020 RepID=UPI00200D72FC|nr:D-alanyl-D-alanine carboxypeptidase family protein [Thiomicrospira microaerophila]UQB41763.1 D-alanyl-D-alanine carboxypeptidase [Thiomicrospira microaerophila]
MKNLFYRSSIFAILTLSLLFSQASRANQPFVSPAPPSFAGTAHIVVDYDSNAIIAQGNPDMLIEPASLTKIMTGYVVFTEIKNERIKLEDMVTISEKAWRMPGSRMFIEVGRQVSVQDLIKGMVIQSGNDASVALAEHIAGTEERFAQLMNQYALELGMTNTNFLNSTGLPDPEHLTTVRDLSILTRALIRDFPEFYNWYSEKRFTYNGITQYNRNRLLWQDPTVDGLKTGHTSSAGYCLVSSANRNDMRVIVVVAGTESASQRISESQKLLNYAFRFYETHKLYEKDQRLIDARVWLGVRDTLGLGIAEEVYVTVPRGQYQNLKIDTLTPKQIEAPIALGDPIGQLVISLHDEILVEKPLIALADIEQASFFKRLMDRIKLLFRGLFGKEV